MPEARRRDELNALCQALVSGLRGILGEGLHAAYVYGAMAFPETEDTGDVDFHVILRRRPSEAEREELAALHAELARRFPPLGVELDGYYLLLNEARRSEPPHHQLRSDVVDDSWALHRAHLLAGRALVLYGPDPKSVYIPPTREEIDEALDGELEYVSQHLSQYPDYCVLNLCRLLYSWETGDVVTSKAASAAWASNRFSEWAPLIDLALASYAKRATSSDRRALADGLESYYPFACEIIAALRGGRGR
jgi:hypothetical protein